MNAQPHGSVNGLDSSKDDNDSALEFSDDEDNPLAEDMVPAAPHAQQQYADADFPDTTDSEAPALRHRLRLSPQQLSTLQRIVDAALNVPNAQASADAGLGRAAAIGALRGRRMMRAVVDADSAVKALPLDGPPKKKRRSGRSNWPHTQLGRAILAQRLSERQVLLRATGQLELHHPQTAAANEEEKSALRALRGEVAAVLGMDAGALPHPDATVYMLARPTRWVRQPRNRHRLRVSVALHEQPPPEVEGVASLASLAPADAIVYATSQRHRERSGDFRRRVTFTLATPYDNP